MIGDDPFGGGTFCALAPAAQRQWRFHAARLPGTGATHGMLVPEPALYAAERPDFLLLARTAEEAPLLHYRFLNRRLDLPLHPSWIGWLWERGLNSGEVRPLDGLGVHAWRCVPDPGTLGAALGRALRGHRLPLPAANQAVAA